MLEIGLFLILGLAVGSFLNVVIARLPRIMEREWSDAALALAQEKGWTAPPTHDDRPEPILSLSVPASHCLACQTPISWYHNIPLLGFALLRGRCKACGQTISWQYPAIELVTALWFGASLWWWGLSITACAWMAWGATLIALSVIDARTQYLPDALTQPLCWAGLIAASMGWIAVDAQSALLGAVAGYLLLYGVAAVFRHLRGIDGMGQGDFKLLAALGAWMGWQSLSALVLIASVMGLLHGGLRLKLQPDASPYFPFGPSLCLAAWALVIWNRGQPMGWFP